MSVSPGSAAERVVITRAAHQSTSWVRAFTEAGFEVHCLPLLEVVPEAAETVQSTLEGVADCHWWAFTSPNAVAPFFAAHGLPKDNIIRIAAVGPSTAAALQRRGLEPSLVAPKARASGLLEVLLPHLQMGDRVLIPQADDARPDLTTGLRAAGFEVFPVVVYRKRLPPAASQQAGAIFASDPLGWVTFSSPRIVRHFVELLGAEWPARCDGLRAISIGPVTSEALRQTGVRAIFEAEEPTPSAMVRAVVHPSGPFTALLRPK